MNEYLENARAGIRRSVERYLPDAPNFIRVRMTGGSIGDTGEQVGQTREEHEFRAVEDPFNKSQDYTGGVSDPETSTSLGVLERHAESNDKIERKSDGKTFRVTNIREYGGVDGNADPSFFILELTEVSG